MTVQYFGCMAVPEKLPSWVHSVEKNESGAYLVGYEDSNPEWQSLEEKNAAQGYIPGLDNLLHQMGFKLAEFPG